MTITYTALPESARLVTRVGLPNATLGINTATVVKTGAGNIGYVSVTVAGSAAGAVYDAKSTSGNASANQIAAIPNTVGVYPIDFPTGVGLVIAPGTGQTVAVTWN